MEEKSGSGCAVAIGVIAAVLIILTFLFFNSAGCERARKSIKSDFGGGLERTVTVYDYSGEVIRQWTGKFDISERDDEIQFDTQDGKRVIVRGGIVISEED